MRGLLVRGAAFLFQLLIVVMFITVFERKILSFSQLRVGPLKVRGFGALQASLDGLKLVFKEFFIIGFSKVFLGKVLSCLLIGARFFVFFMVNIKYF